MANELIHTLLIPFAILIGGGLILIFICWIISLFLFNDKNYKTPSVTQEEIDNYIRNII